MEPILASSLSNVLTVPAVNGPLWGEHHGLKQRGDSTSSWEWLVAAESDLNINRMNVTGNWRKTIKIARMGRSNGKRLKGVLWCEVDKRSKGGSKKGCALIISLPVWQDIEEHKRQRSKISHFQIKCIFSLACFFYKHQKCSTTQLHLPYLMKDNTVMANPVEHYFYWLTAVITKKFSL